MKTAAGPHYPGITVQLTGEDGNAFLVLCKVSYALREAGVEEERVEIFFREASAGNYDHLLRVAMEWVSVQ